MTDNNDAALIAALRESGHHDAADHVRDTALAADLRAAGHPQLAEALAAKGGSAQPATAPDPAPHGES